MKYPISILPRLFLLFTYYRKLHTVKLGDKEHFGAEEPFPMTNLLHKDKEKFEGNQKVPITKLDCNK